MERYICLHGHFYQPPRESPWLERVELQDSAYPYHDWNERVTAECYAPNAAARILNAEDQIIEIVNNYPRISFDFGPTLLVWMERNAPEVYQALLEADRESQRAFSGHGSALAQAYNHVILPLATTRDKYAQVLWGIRDFEHRFGRKPEGMWLPETAVDLETLDILAELGIRFTILAPRQASRVRRMGDSTWSDASGGDIDPTMAYELPLASGRRLSLFFYDDAIAHAVAFEGLLTSGESFAHRLTNAFSQARPWPQLVHIATDGETYGHHHRFGEMALAYALHHLGPNGLAQLTNYGEYLERHPPTHEVGIIETTSWSCAHGVERWRSDCGCNTGGHPGWNQAWRAPLKQALDWLRDTLAPKYQRKAGKFLKDPWAARNDYIEVVLDRSLESVERFLARHAVCELKEADKTTILKLLELQRHAMLMYTSDGWFFDDLSGIETVQVIQHAGRVVQLAEEVLGEALEPRFLELLEWARSNIPEHDNGRRIYQVSVKPAMVRLPDAVAHYAVSSLFEDYGKQAKVGCYSMGLEDYQTFEAGKAKLVVGRVRSTSEVTWETDAVSFAVLYLGEHHLNAGVRRYQGEEAYHAMLQETTQAFFKADFPQVLRLLDRHLGTSSYSLRSLFRDEQRKIVGRILESTLGEVEAMCRDLYERHYPLMRFLTDLGHPLPQALPSAAEFIVNADLRRALRSGTLDLRRARSLLDNAREWNIALDVQGLGYELAQTLAEMMNRFVSAPGELALLKSLAEAIALARSMALEVNLWKVENSYYAMLHTAYPGFRERARKGEAEAAEWVTEFVSLGKLLSIKVA